MYKKNTENIGMLSGRFLGQTWDDFETFLARFRDVLGMISRRFRAEFGARCLG